MVWDSFDWFEKNTSSKLLTLEVGLIWSDVKQSKVFAGGFALPHASNTPHTASNYDW